MYGIILCGGTGSRLQPLTNVTNKHLLPIYDKPMIYYPIQTLIDAGINKIIIVTGKECAGDFLNLLGSGKEFGVDFTYKLQDNSGGIAEALKICKNMNIQEEMAVILGDNVFYGDLSGPINDFLNHTAKNEYKAAIFSKQVNDPFRFGVVETDKFYGNKVISIEEKPKNPKSNLAQTGLYLYNSQVFEEIEKLELSDRQELEITDLNNIYLKRGELKNYNIEEVIWFDAGTYNSLCEANNTIRSLKL